MFYEVKDVPPFKISHFPQQRHLWTLINTETKVVQGFCFFFTQPHWSFLSYGFHTCSRLGSVYLFSSLNDTATVNDCTFDC